MSQKYPGVNFDTMSTLNVGMMISATFDHLIHVHSSSGEKAIIRADLHALANPVDVVYNYLSIMEESMQLYKIDEKTFAENNIRFMGGNPISGNDRGLYGRVEKNMETDPDHREFYEDVKRGIVSTINLSRIIRGEL